MVIGGRHADELKKVTAEHPELGAVTIDTTDPTSLEKATTQVLTEYPDLNVVIAMAGIMRIEDWRHSQSFLDTAQSVIETNVVGPIRLIAAFIEHLQKQPDSTIHHRVVGPGVRTAAGLTQLQRFQRGDSHAQ